MMKQVMNNRRDAIYEDNISKYVSGEIQINDVVKNFFKMLSSIKSYIN